MSRDDLIASALAGTPKRRGAGPGFRVAARVVLVGAWVAFAGGVGLMVAESVTGWFGGRLVTALIGLCGLATAGLAFVAGGFGVAVLSISRDRRDGDRHRPVWAALAFLAGAFLVMIGF